MERRSVVIAGASAPEAVKLIEAINDAGDCHYEIEGFLDDDPQKAGREFMGYRVLGPIRLLAGIHRRHWVVNNVAGTTAARMRVAQKIVDTGAARIATLVHPGVDLRHAEVGAGTIVQEGCIVAPLVRIGAHCLLNYGSIDTHECAVGDFVFLAPGVILNGRARVEDGAFVGAGAVILPYRTVHAWSVVGAGSTVTRDVAAGAKVCGCPARVMEKAEGRCA